jgi:hypothetical protein
MPSQSGLVKQGVGLELLRNALKGFVQFGNKLMDTKLENADAIGE